MSIGRKHDIHNITHRTNKGIMSQLYVAKTTKTTRKENEQFTSWMK